MPAIDRGLDSLSFLSEPLRDALRRRLREVGGLALLVGCDPAGARARDLVGAGPLIEPRHQPADSKRARRPRRHRRRPADAALRHGGARAASAARHLGLAAGHAPHLCDVSAFGFASGSPACCWRQPAHPACRGARLGRCRRDWAGLSAIGCCACRLSFPAKVVGGLAQATVAIATGTGALICCAIAAGFGLRGGGDAGDEDDAGASEQEGGLISLGWVVHGFLSLKARVGRLLARTPWLRSEADRAPASGRAEPRFGGRSTPVRTRPSNPKARTTKRKRKPARPRPRRASPALHRGRRAGSTAAMCCPRSRFSPCRKATAARS